MPLHIADGTGPVYNGLSQWSSSLKIRQDLVLEGDLLITTTWVSCDSPGLEQRETDLAAIEARHAFDKPDTGGGGRGRATAFCSVFKT